MFSLYKYTHTFFFQFSCLPAHDDFRHGPPRAFVRVLRVVHKIPPYCCADTLPAALLPGEATQHPQSLVCLPRRGPAVAAAAYCISVRRGARGKRDNTTRSGATDAPNATALHEGREPHSASVLDFPDGLTTAVETRRCVRAPKRL